VRVRIPAAAFLLAFIGVGCLPPPQTIYRQHSAVHGCAENDVHVVTVEAGVSERLDRVSRFRATGCGHEDIYYCRSNVCESAREVVVKRQEAEFDCRPGEVEVRSLGGGAWLADGCGERRTYNCLWASGGLRCIAETRGE
jgi:hypothetical protein